MAAHLGSRRQSEASGGFIASTTILGSVLVSSRLPADRLAAGRQALAAPLRRLDGGSATLGEHLADPLIVLVWASW